MEFVARVSYDTYYNDDGKLHLNLKWHNAIAMSGCSSWTLLNSRQCFPILGIRIDGEALIFKILVREYYDNAEQLIEDFFENIGKKFVWVVDLTDD